MTNKELADKIISDAQAHTREVLECARRLRELPDPAPSEPEYGWDQLANDIGCRGDYYHDIKFGWTRHDMLRGRCVRLMRERGWLAIRVADEDPLPHWLWAYSKQISLASGDRMGQSPSEPAAWRDMLKHAGVI